MPILRPNTIKPFGGLQFSLTQLTGNCIQYDKNLYNIKLAYSQLLVVSIAMPLEQQIPVPCLRIRHGCMIFWANMRQCDTHVTGTPERSIS